MSETDDGPELEICQCWCGARGAYEDLYDDSGLDTTCGGLGVLNCYCGGDQCVCHHHGETHCFGCEDCEDLLDDYEDDYGDEDDDIDSRLDFYYTGLDPELRRRMTIRQWRRNRHRGKA